MSEIVIRPAHADELDEVLVLWRAADAIPSVSDDLGSLMALLHHDPGSLLVADADGRIVGTLIAAWDGWRGTMYRMAVHPDFRRTRLGLRLAGAGEERLRALGAKRIGAIIMADHEHALRFWAAAGYRHDDRVVRYVIGDDPPAR